MTGATTVAVTYSHRRLAGSVSGHGKVTTRCVGDCGTSSGDDVIVISYTAAKRQDPGERVQARFARTKLSRWVLGTDGYDRRQVLGMHDAVGADAHEDGP
jgi:hypothetical protein